jgi:hypothetical protein
MFNPDDSDRFRNARDRNGVLRDGKSMRVPMHLRDHSTVRKKFIDARQYWDSQRESLVVVDSDSTNTSGNRPGFRLSDAPINGSARAAAYRAHENYLRDAWKGRDDSVTGAGERGSTGYLGVQREGTPCTKDGWPGVLRRDKNGNFYCDIGRTDAKPTADRMHDHQQRMAALYDAIEAEQRNAWRRG